MKKGFTIIEILVAFVIVAILTTFGVGTYNNSVAKANNLRITATASEYIRAAKRYFVLNGTYPSAGDLEFHCLGTQTNDCGIVEVAWNQNFLFETAHALRINRKIPEKIKGYAYGKERNNLKFFDKSRFRRSVVLEKEIEKGFERIEDKKRSLPKTKLPNRKKWEGILYRCLEAECKSIEVAWVLSGKKKNCRVKDSKEEQDDLIDSTKATLCSFISI